MTALRRRARSPLRRRSSSCRLSVLMSLACCALLLGPSLAQEQVQPDAGTAAAAAAAAAAGSLATACGEGLACGETDVPVNRATVVSASNGTATADDPEEEARSVELRRAIVSEELEKNANYSTKQAVADAVDNHMQEVQEVAKSAALYSAEAAKQDAAAFASDMSDAAANTKAESEPQQSLEDMVANAVRATVNDVRENYKYAPPNDVEESIERIEGLKQNKEVQFLVQEQEEKTQQKAAQAGGANSESSDESSGSGSDESSGSSSSSSSSSGSSTSSDSSSGSSSGASKGGSSSSESADRSSGGSATSESEGDDDEDKESADQSSGGDKSSTTSDGGSAEEKSGETRSSSTSEGGSDSDKSSATSEGDSTEEKSSSTSEGGSDSDKSSTTSEDGSGSGSGSTEEKSGETKSSSTSEGGSDSDKSSTTSEGGSDGDKSSTTSDGGSDSEKSSTTSEGGSGSTEEKGGSDSEKSSTTSEGGSGSTEEKGGSDSDEKSSQTSGGSDSDKSADGGSGSEGEESGGESQDRVKLSGSESGSEESEESSSDESGAEATLPPLPDVTYAVQDLKPPPEPTFPAKQLPPEPKVPSPPPISPTIRKEIEEQQKKEAEKLALLNKTQNANATDASLGGEAVKKNVTAVVNETSSESGTEESAESGSSEDEEASVVKPPPKPPVKPPPEPIRPQYFDDRVCIITSFYGGNLRVESDLSITMVDSLQRREFEKWKITPNGRGKYYIESFFSSFIEGDGPAVTSKDKKSDKQLWSIVSVGNGRYFITNSEGRSLSGNRAGSLSARKNKRDREQWTIDLTDGYVLDAAKNYTDFKVYVQSAQGTLLSVKPNHGVGMDDPATKRVWEQWTVSQASNGLYYITSYYKQQLYASYDGVTTKKAEDDDAKYYLLPADKFGSFFITSATQRRQLIADGEKVKFSSQSGPAEMWNLTLTDPGDKSNFTHYLNKRVYVRSFQFKTLLSVRSDLSVEMVNPAVERMWEEWVLTEGDDGHVYITSVFDTRLGPASADTVTSSSKKGGEVMWLLVPAGNGTFFISSMKHRTQLAADRNNDIRLVHNRGTSQRWQFEIAPVVPKKIPFLNRDVHVISARGKLLSVRPDKGVDVQPPNSARLWEHWRCEHVKDNIVRFKSWYGTRLNVNAGGSAKTTSKTGKEDGVDFFVIPVGGGKFFLSSVFRTQMSVTDGGSVSAVPERGASELFTFKIVSEPPKPNFLGSSVLIVAERYNYRLAVRHNLDVELDNTAKHRPWERWQVQQYHEDKKHTYVIRSFYESYLEGTNKGEVNSVLERKETVQFILTQIGGNRWYISPNHLRVQLRAQSRSKLAVTDSFDRNTIWNIYPVQEPGLPNFKDKQWQFLSDYGSRLYRATIGGLSLSYKRTKAGQWDIKELKDGRVRISNRDDLALSATADNKVKLSTETNKTEEWKIVPLGEDQYMIMSPLHRTQLSSVNMVISMRTDIGDNEFWDLEQLPNSDIKPEGCKKPMRRPAGDAGSFLDAMQRYMPGWYFSGGWHFASKATIVGDFNGDGRDDYARLGSTYMHLFISKGAGEFWMPVYPFPRGWAFGHNENHWTTLRPMDVNNDGRMDIVRTHATYNHAFIGRGKDRDCFLTNRNPLPRDCFRVTTYKYRSGWVFSNHWSFNSENTLFGDFSGDGRADYVRLGPTYAHFFISKGDGQFWSPVHHYRGWNFGWDNYNAYRPKTLDLNGDCLVDIARANGRVFYTFTMAKTDKRCWEIDSNMPADCITQRHWVFPHGWNFHGGWTWNSRAMVVGDFNNDHMDDFARIGGTYIHYFISKGDGTFWYPIYPFPHGWNFGHNEAVWTTIQGDFDGDAHMDILRTYYTYNHAFFPRGANDRCWHKNLWIPRDCMRVTTYHYMRGWSFSGGWTWLSDATVVGDFNGDGRDDYLNLRGPLYNFQYISGASSGILGDWNAKCKKAIRSPRHHVGSFDDRVQAYVYGWRFMHGWSFDSRATIWGDFNGDKKGDYARLGGTYIHFFISKGNGQFFMPVYRFPRGWNFGHNEDVWTTLNGVDLNGDGRTDVLRTYRTYNHGFISQGSNAACFATNRNPTPQNCFRITTHRYRSGWNFHGAWEWNSDNTLVADFNGDSKTDFARLGPRYIHFFISKGNGQFWAPIWYNLMGWNFGWDNNNAYMAKALDLDGDCRSDIMRTHGRVAYTFIMRRAVGSCWTWDDSILPNCIVQHHYVFPHGWYFRGGWTWNSRAMVVGDFNGDHFTDFVRIGGTYFHFFISQGNGNFWWPIYPVPRGWNFGHNEAVWTTIGGDFDGDGHTDILRTYYTYNHAFFPRGKNKDCWKRNGWVSRGCMQVTSNSYHRGWSFSGHWRWNSEATVVLDVTGDGRDDYMNLRGDRFNHVFVSGPKTRRPPQARYHCKKPVKAPVCCHIGEWDDPVQGYPNYWSFAGGWSFDEYATLVGDFNGDGKSDYARLGGTYVHFFISRGHGKFWMPVYRFPRGWNFGHDEERWTSLKALDLNGDGKSDFVRTYHNYNHAFISAGSNGACWFTNKNPIPLNCFRISAHRYAHGWWFSGGWRWDSFNRLEGDFNGDGKDDWVRLGPTYAHFFISQGNGQTWDNVYHYHSHWNFGWDNPHSYQARAMDINSDCHMDILRFHPRVVYSFIMYSKDQACWQHNDVVLPYCIEQTHWVFPYGWRFHGGWSFVSRAFVTGDFNGDGKVDFVRLGGTYFHFFISAGHGSFYWPIYPVPHGWNFGHNEDVWTTIAADYDADGRMDLLRTYYTYNHLFSARGNHRNCWRRNGWISRSCMRVTTYGYRHQWSFSGAFKWNSLHTITGDFNGDGRDDYANLGGNKFGHFFISGRKRPYPIHPKSHCKRPVRTPGKYVGQFDDPVVGYPVGWNFVGGWSFDAKALLVGDFNGDKKSDYARLGGTYIHFFVSKGDGRFWMPVYQFPKGWNFGHNEDLWTSFKAIDLNGDGKSDIVRAYRRYNHGFISQGSNSNCWFTDKNTPQNCFRITTHYWRHGWNFVGGWKWNSDNVLFGDFNGDRKEDFARLGPTYTHFFISKGNGDFWSPVWHNHQGWNFGWDNNNNYMPRALDINGDCRTDILRLHGRVAYTFIPLNSNADCWQWDDNMIPTCILQHHYVFPHGWYFRGGWTWNSRAFVSGDFNGDGFDDIARLGGSYIHFFISQGNGNYWWPIYHFGSGWNFGHNENGWTSSYGDFDGDGRTDILRTHYTYAWTFYPRGSQSYCWKRNGWIPSSCMDRKQYTYHLGWVFNGGWRWNSKAFVTADWNGDGRDDFANLMGGTYGHIFISGLKKVPKPKMGKCSKKEIGFPDDEIAGVFAAKNMDYPRGWNFKASWSFDSLAFLSGDFNNDGKDDYARLGGRSIYFFISKGDGNYWHPIYKFPNRWDFGHNEHKWTSLPAMDLNGDGKDDIVRTHARYNHVFLNQGDDKSCWKTDTKDMPKKCFATPTYTYRDGWNFVGNWAWKSPQTINGDFNGDGRGDFARLGPTYIHFFISKGNGHFWSPVWHNLFGWNFGYDLTGVNYVPQVMDINGDCRTDIVRIGTRTAHSFIIHRHHDDCWTADRDMLPNCIIQRHWTYPHGWNFVHGWSFASKAGITGDFNGDGQDDFARVGGTYVHFFISKGNGQFWYPVFYFRRGLNFGHNENSWTTLCGDFDGDGRWDIIRTSQTSQHGFMSRGSNDRCWTRDGTVPDDCMFHTTYSYPFGAPPFNSRAATVVDVNGDHRDDILNLHEGKKNYVWVAKSYD